ncbi:autotransporter domain-containing protein [Hoeflea sp.]|uniref:autotransporter domain-containing protein n=1 Tax=Hoeflea sp. TaxID=1940281 RepID=UPI0019A74485|nr:autotransporter domain-containing protein [Hoeflea sp.]MBC7283895.1 autotransporter domain-containing protein [Hoeflea sp.]
MRVTTWRFMRLRRKAVPPVILRRNLTRRLLSSVGVAALLAGVSLALLPAPTRADTSWTGAADSDWNNAANWSNGLPVNTSGTTKIEGPVAATVDGVSVADSGRTNIGSAAQDGSLIVQGGGTLNAGVFELFGYNGFSGTATIRGAGSGISTSSSLFVGAYTGVGHIFIEDGGTLTTPYSTYMSQYNGSLGTVTVTGSGSTWNSNYEINLGGAEGNYDATGILTIADDGLVNINNGNRNLNVAKSTGSTGTLNIGAAEGDAAVAAGSLQAKSVVFGAGDGTLVFNHTETDYTFAPSISGNGGVHQLAGTTNLSGSNSWSGSTLVEGGILRAGAAGALSANAAYTVNGGTLDLNDFDLTATELSGTGGTVDLGTAELEVDQDGDSVFDGLIAGAGSLVKLGSGILSLTGANTYSGGTTLGEGTLRLEDDDAIGTGALTVTGGTLDYDDGIDLSNDIDLRAQATLNVTTGSATQSGNIGETGGSFGIVKSGAGILSLTGANTYTGTTTVSGGTLRAGSADALVSGAYILNGGTLDLNDFDLSASGLSGASGTVDLGSAELEVDQDSDGVFGGIISGAGSLLKLGSGMLTLTGGSTYTGLTTIREGTLALDGGSVESSDDVIIGDLAHTVGEVTVTGAGASLDTDSSVLVGELGEGTLNVENGGVVTADVVIAGHLSGSDGTIRVTGTDSQVNSTSLLRIGDEGVGRLVVSGGGAVTNTSAGYIGAGTNGEGTATVTGTGSKFDNSGILYVGGEYNGAVGVLTIADEGAVNVGAGSGTVRVGHHSGATGTLNVGAASGDDAVAAGTLNAASVQFGAGTGQIVFNHLDDGHVFSGDISGAGEVLHLSGTTIMNGENTYTGGTIVSGGTLRAGGADAFTSGAYEVNGGTLDLNDLDFSISSLSGAGGTVDLGSGELEVRQEDSDGIFGGIIAGAGSLVKLGSSILTLSGASTFSGGTTLGEGTLRLEHDDAIGTGTLAVTGGIVDYDDGVDIANEIDLQANAMLNVTTGSATQSGNIGETDGSFGIVKTGIGELVLTGSNSFTGGIAVNAGRLTGDTESLVGDISIGLAVLEFNQTSAGEFTGAITGTGTVLKTGEGEAVFSGSGIAADYFYVRGTGAVIDGGIVDIANRLDVSNSIESGEDTDSSLTIRGGATVASGEGRIGDIDDFSAAITVSGAGTAWTVGDFMDPTQFLVAGRGEASLLVEDGAEVTIIGSANIFSRNGGPAASITITGTDSLFEVTETLRVGTDGTGHLTIADGGSVFSSAAEIGRQSERTGIVSIAGTGSRWLIDDTELLLGGDSDSVPGTGHITLSEGGLLELGSSAGTLFAAVGDASIARINIGAAEGDDAVAAGTLDVATIAFDDDGGGDGRLTFNHTEDDFEFAAALTGQGSVSHLAGNTTLTGLSSGFTGITSVSGGRLDIDGVLGGSVTVANGRLGGSGTVGGTSFLGGGILSPGNSIGTLTVAGDLDFGDGSFYEVEVNDGGFVAGVNADFVHVTGAATIASGAVVEVAPANGTDDGITYAPSTTYRILTADGGISGVFDGVTAGFAFLMPEVSYDATNVFLTLTQMAAFEDVASTPNQQGVAAAAEALGAGNPLYDEIIGMSEEEAQAAFDALSGEAHASSTGVFSSSAGIVRRTIFSRLFSRFGAPRGFAAAEGYVPAAGDETPHGYTVWGELVRGWGETDGSVSAAGIERNSTGFLGGVDREIGEASRIGIALGYSHATFDVSGRASSGESDNFHVAGYAGTELGPMDLKGVLGYSYQMAESRRRVVVGGVIDDLSADYGAHTLQASGEASVDLAAGPVTLTPFAGLAVVHVETEAFTETGGPSALSIASSSNTTGISELGLRAAREAGSLTLFGSASWRHVFGDVEPLSRASFASSPATTFSVRGTPLSEDVASIGGGVELLIAEETTLEFSYRGEFASDSRDHGLKAKVSIRF